MSDFMKVHNEELLLETIHRQFQVVEVYLNPANQLISELVYSFREVEVHQCSLAQYLRRRPQLKVNPSVELP